MHESDPLVGILDEYMDKLKVIRNNLHGCCLKQDMHF